jgi:sugar-specific transcriptional regulator TrmB
MDPQSSATEVFERLELTEYEAKALEQLLSMGLTTAPTLAEATDIPKARIYGVLDSLADHGYVKVISGRPTKYQPKSPEEILDQAIENRRQEYERHRQTVEELRDGFLTEFGPRYRAAGEDVRPAEELFYVVDVGQPSERETRGLYHDAETEVYVLSKSFDYFESVEPAIEDALDRDISIRVLLLNPGQIEPEKRDRQAEVVDRIREEYPGIDVRFSNEQLPWRGTFVDPSMDYSTGKAILLVEEEDVPNYLRQAAITENGSFVAGLKRYFDLVWTHDSAPEV